ncbi:SGNH/GDSL hydrolase family protein [Pseudomonas marincola]|uniref:SGNH/GDSL hydrolase family protein n=1 Tax=Pseudomonas marincola TaxID=437900 RepID=UPI0008EA005E|nr:SGNH/GDSL hydrolase family protein [Pseudomonas marincola]SFT53149.1 Lysophospholipase L1 [Pseudomonas marincola]
MSAALASAWWLLVLALSPVVLPMAVLTRRKALRLMPAAGEQAGVAGAALAGEPLRLLVLGESTAVGVGVSCMQLALAGQLAGAMSQRFSRPVAWQVCGENGITAAKLHQRYVSQRSVTTPAAGPHDLVVVLLGVNDTTHLSSLKRWQASLQQIVQGLQHHAQTTADRVVFSGVPPLQHFTALPWLFRRLLGLRAAMLDRAMRESAAATGAQYLALDLDFAAHLMAVDGYHPSAAGYRLWADNLLLGIRLQPQGSQA